jgi:hypothetical protein
VANYGFQWLDHFTSLDQILSELEGGSESPEVGPFKPRTSRLIAMRIRLARGERDLAEADFSDYLCNLPAQSQQGHLALLARIASEEGFETKVPL